MFQQKSLYVLVKGQIRKLDAEQPISPLSNSDIAIA